MMLSDSDFKKLIEGAPLISIDLIIENEKGEVLMGLRKNAPAKGYYFVPGGRIRKNETFANAVKRISLSELGCEIEFEDLSPIGFFEQFYDDNFFEQANLSTHYIALAYQYIGPRIRDIKPDLQHDEYSYFSKNSIMANPQIHYLCKRYFLS